MIVSQRRRPGVSGFSAAAARRVRGAGLLVSWSAAALLGLFSAGCTSLDLAAKMPFGGSADDKPKTPSKIVTVWSEEVLHPPGEKSVRGFAGRLMFYAGEDPKPVKVDGTFSVFVFDDVDRQSGYSAPERKFVYRPEELPKYYSKSELGHSYSVWLPWDEVGGPERRLSLIARFEPKKGAPIVAKPSAKTLGGRVSKPGEPPPSSIQLTTHTSPAVPDAPETPAVRAASHVGGGSELVPSAAALSTITIDVPPSFARASRSSDASSIARAEPSARNDEKTTAPQSNAAPAATTSAQAGSAAGIGGSSTASPGAVSPGASARRSEASAPHATRFGRPRFPARRESTAPQGSDPVRKPPLPATSLSRLPPTPRFESR